jgi:outer membrane protein assembly factor BamB
MSSATARHDPIRLISPDVSGDSAVFRWDKAPAFMVVEHLEHEAKDGSRLAVPISATPIVLNGVVLTCGYDGRIRLHERRLGTHEVIHRINEPIYPTPVLTTDGRVIVVGSHGRLICLDSTGKVLWETDTGAPAAASPTLFGDDRVAVCGLGGQLTVASSFDGERLVSARLPRPWSHALGSPDAERDPYATPVATPGRLVVAAGEQVISLDENGRSRWTVDLDAAVRSSPVFVAETGHVVLGLVDGRVMSLDAGTGAVTATARLPGPIHASPAVSGARLCFSTTAQVFGLTVDPLAIVWSREDAVRDHGSVTLAPNGDFTYVARGGAIVAVAPDDGRFRYELRLRTAQQRLRFDGTPAVSADGWLYGASYDGFVASFAFQGA